MIVAFTDGIEILVTTEDNRDQFIKEFFVDGGRDHNDYSEIKEPKFLRITPELDEIGAVLKVK